MMFPFMIIPFIPTMNEKPPTLYSILNSIVNFNNDNPVKIKDLANAGRSKIFNFEYSLTSNISKQDFECMILNHFMMRRIGYETVTAFQLALNVKLNEIMENYNLLFNAIENWDLFKDGEEIVRNQTDNRNTTSNNNLDNKTSSSNISDRRYSELPQSEIQNVQDGSYLTQYNYDTDNGGTKSNSKGNSTTIDNDAINENIKRSPADKINLYKNFLESKQNIYTMIFKDLDSLFYQLD